MKKIRRGGDKGDSDDGGGDEGRKRAEEQKENYISWLVLEDLLLPRPPFSNYATLPASSLFHEIQPCCPFASFQEPSPPSPPCFRRQPTRLTIARLPDPHDRMAKRMRESVDAADELPSCASSPYADI